MRPAFSLLALLPLSACFTGEDIRVRDRDGLLLSGRARFTAPVIPAGNISLGAEFGAFGSSADFTSPTGRKDYRISVGYAAFAADIAIGKVHLLPKIGVGLGDFAVQGQVRDLREDGLGGVVGIEGRYLFADPFGAFVRGTAFRRSSLETGLLEAGLSWQPGPLIAFELGYALASNVIQESDDFFGFGDNADVETQGLLASMTIQL